MLPLNGKIIVIDDDENEALPLIKSLFKKGIALNYYTGLEQNELPIDPFSNVRLIFLDIVLGTEVTASQKTKISKTISILNRIVSPKNPPYVIIAWTKQPELIDSLYKTLTKKPLQIIDLNKLECKDEEGKYSIELISNKIEEKIKELSIIQLFYDWEDIINNSVDELLEDVLGLVQMNELWSENLVHILYKMAMAATGKQIKNINNNNSILKHTFSVIIPILTDKIETRVNSFEYKNASKINFSANIYSTINKDKKYTIRFEDNKFKFYIDEHVIFEGKKGKPFHHLYDDIRNGKQNTNIIQSLPILTGSEKKTVERINKEGTGPKNDLEKKIFNKYLEEKTIIDDIFKTNQVNYSKINTYLFINSNIPNDLHPGNVYANSLDIRTKLTLAKNYFESSYIDTINSTDFSLIHILEMEISPICDFAQDEWKIARLLPGILYP